MKNTIKSLICIFACLGVHLLAVAANDTDYGPFGSSADWTYEAGNKDRTATPVIGLSSAVYIGAHKAAEGDCIAAYRKDKNVICGLARVDASGKTGIKFEITAGVTVHFKIWVAASGTDNPRIYDVDSSCDFKIPSTDEPTVSLGALTVTLQKTFKVGDVSHFDVDEVGSAALVGVSEAAWRDFSGADYYNTQTFVNANIIDAEKTAADDNDDYWCYPMSDMNALFLTGWAKKTSYATVDDMVEYFRKNPKLLRYMQSGELQEGTYGYDGIFEWYKDTTGIDIEGLDGVVTEGEVDGSFISDLRSLLNDGSHVIRINVGFDNVLYNKKWKGWSVLHGVLCVGYVADGNNLKALFIIDPDNNQYTGTGGKSAPNSIMYCPVSWSAALGRYTISGVWGQDGWIDTDWKALKIMEREPNVYSVTFDKNGGTGTMAAQKFTEGVAQGIAPCAFSKQGYEFVGWKDQNGLDYADGEEISPVGDLLLTAQWKLIPILSLSKGNATHGWRAANGSFGVDCNMGWQASTDDDWITLAVTEGSGNATVSYSVSENTGTEPHTGTITVTTEDCAKSATFEVTQRGWSEGYTVTFLPGEGGEGTMEPQDFEDGVPQALARNGFSCPGYVFLYWKDQNGSIYTDGIEVTLEEDLTLTAQWTQRVHFYAFAFPDQSSAKGKVTVSPKPKDGTATAGYVQIGTTMTITAKPSNAKTVFAYWEDMNDDFNVVTSADGTRIGYTAAIKVSPDEADNTYVAVFRLASACKRPVFDAENPYGDGYESVNSMVGVAYKAQIVVNEDAYPVKFTAKNLPPGLKINATTGVISGVPTKAGNYNPTITVASAANTKLKSSSVKLPMEIAALPAWAKGSFAGRTYGDESLESGSVLMKVGSTGKISGNINLGGTNWVVSASSWTVDSTPLIPWLCVSGTATCTIGKTTYKAPWALILREEEDEEFSAAVGTGRIGNSGFEVLRIPWGDAGMAATLAQRTGVYDWLTADGEAFALTLDAKGNVKAVGTLANGRAVSVSSPLIFTGNSGLAMIYAAPQTVKNKKGKVTATYPAFFSVVILRNSTGKPVAGGLLAYRRQGVRAAIDDDSTGTGTIKYSTSYGQAEPGKSVTLTATAAKGSVFAYWMHDGEIVGYSSSYKVTMGEGDYEGVTAVFRKTSDFKTKPPAPSLVDEDVLANLRVGVAFRAVVEIDEAFRPVTFTAKNLPAGLKLNATTGVISGVPTAKGSKSVSITATSVANKKLVSPALKFTAKVAALDKWAQGTFNGVGGLGDKEAKSVTMTVGATGKVSGKFAIPNGKKTVYYSFASSYFAEFDYFYVARGTMKVGSASCPFEIYVDTDGNGGGFAEIMVYDGDDVFGSAELKWKK